MDKRFPDAPVSIESPVDWAHQRALNNFPPRYRHQSFSPRVHSHMQGLMTISNERRKAGISDSSTSPTNSTRSDRPRWPDSVRRYLERGPDPAITKRRRAANPPAVAATSCAPAPIASTAPAIGSSACFTPLCGRRPLADSDTLGKHVASSGPVGFVLVVALLASVAKPHAAVTVGEEG